ncbi:hypothetical protein ZEAMMB73_Zm00001d025914 [Zea mays]|uniref:Uncharacterized protein n=1 Tax=Zea mays TaxID=4577 RepID=A0A1D6JAS7_MAIZE|nr:hypothetical protein ZEAMMB73_Zm00001d025914 [Zea mays]
MAATPDRVNADLHRRLAVDTPPPPQVARVHGSKVYDQIFVYQRTLKSPNCPPAELVTVTRNHHFDAKEQMRQDHK